MRPVIFISLIFNILSSFCIYGQSDSIDLKLIELQNFKDQKIENYRIITYGINQNKTFIQKYNPISLTFSGLMFFYQKVLSPQISADCLYSPSCSEYSRQLFLKYGFIKGLIFSADRIMRCDRISATTIHQISIDNNDGRVHETVERYKLNN